MAENTGTMSNVDQVLRILNRLEGRVRSARMVSDNMTLFRRAEAFDSAAANCRHHALVCPMLAAIALCRCRLLAASVQVLSRMLTLVK